MTKRRIPPKNYIILFGIIVLVICACLAVNNIYVVLKENRISTSPLATNEVLYEDLKNATKDIDADTFLVISYVQDDKVYSKEKAIKKYMTKHNLFDNIMYLNITDYRNDSNFINDLNGVLKLKNKLAVKKFPAVVYYKEGVPTYTIDSTDHMLNAGDFEQIIDMYELAS